ncbi:HPP family protein [Aureibacter tunicatorum]|uniref:CBS-domain-containing membrane protein n=1 Tax=Aureibacter tunicatorum TaxID=866807 RepID=A0AAE3XM47_9BACT|nr:HPP family protein [Aureibacter tunicatorum]MDR6238306.1 CBS-domain-containing membrane protein [Aureibacter tunicatorum]BDD03338.1 membrane protein [Aureibacter tunicatorum]
MKNYLAKFVTTEKSPNPLSFNISLFSGIGGFIAIATVAFITANSNIPLIMAPFGATCVLAFGVPDSPLAQPRNIIGGHLISTLIGLICLYLFGNEWYSLAIGVGAAIAIMQLSGTTHPPAGADPLLVIMGGCTWEFIINPVFSGAIIITAIACLFNNMDKVRKYPKYWI